MKKRTPHKPLLYLIVSIPLMFLGPIILNIGFIALKKDGIYGWLVLGGFVAVFAIFWAVRAIILLLKSLK